MKIKRLGELVNIRTGKLDANASDENGSYPFFTCSVTPLKIDSYSYDTECVLVAGNGDLNVKYYEGKFDAYQRTYIIESKDKEVLNVKYLFYFLEKYVEKLRSQSIGGVIKYIKLGNLTEALIPIFSVDIQRKIVDVLGKSQFIIEKRQSQIEALDELTQCVFLEMFGDPKLKDSKFRKRPISDFGEVITGNTPSRKVKEYYGDHIEWIKSDNINTPYHFLTTAEEYLSEKGMEKGRVVPENSILITCIAGSKSCIGNAAIADREVAFNQQINAIIPKGNPFFLYTQFLVGKELVQLASTDGMKGLVSKGAFQKIEFICPPNELQDEFGKKFLVIQNQKQQLLTSLQKMEELYESLLQKSFNGELFE
ncbi:restriction endonuclease subunit S [Bacillaceae bacterium CLA-AA-H227]|uniref:Restriction endonuclease subunit S n=1 Tax=Robertmurraya yapensis (ex Hitch et al 2024) TaxID=3133160 RepID=A0ACC6SGE8_9BACI